MIDIIIALLIGLAPIVVWLGFVLWRDIKKPEPIKWLLAAFGTGLLITPLVLILENLYVLFWNKLAGVFSLGDWGILLGAATIEEIIKWFAVYLLLKKNTHFDEAIDAMIYLIVLALGFATVENIIVSYQGLLSGTIAANLQVLGLRFIGANLLHLLCSGFIGFFWAKSLIQKNKKILLLGLILGISLHTIFNMIIMKLGSEFLLIGSGILFIFAMIVLWAFDVLEPIRFKTK
ncbi:MAG: PrsW family glutamic-type intramembrane protease [Candidatus Parcubacteria bacterium]|nr:PrsW family glutamic-type intramembrane protease [Candidatus Parcubacteria bacterium]